MSIHLHIHSNKPSKELLALLDRIVKIQENEKKTDWFAVAGDVLGGLKPLITEFISGKIKQEMVNDKTVKLFSTKDLKKQIKELLDQGKEIDEIAILLNLRTEDVYEMIQDE